MPASLEAFVRSHATAIGQSHIVADADRTSSCSCICSSRPPPVTARTHGAFLRRSFGFGFGLKAQKAFLGRMIFMNIKGKQLEMWTERN
jgi:hypothetical protein